MKRHYRKDADRKHPALRHLIAELLAGEGRQYAAFLLLWQALKGLQAVLRILSLTLLALLADVQELAVANFQLVLALGFRVMLGYALLSLLLFVVAPGSMVMQSFQQYWARRSYLMRQKTAAREACPFGNPSQEAAAEKRSKVALFVRLHRNMEQLLQEGDRDARRYWQRKYRGNTAKLRYRLWLRMPLRTILYLPEIFLSLAGAAVFYALMSIQGFSVLS